MKWLKNFAQWIIPYNFWNLLRDYRLKKIRARRQAPPSGHTQNRSYDDLIVFLKKLGCEETSIREGSIPESSLVFIIEHLEKASKQNPLIGLHVGNFVGVSLAYLTQQMVGKNRASLMISIDPNIEHRGIKNPMSEVLSLLDFCHVSQQSIILTGYSLEKSSTNDGLDYEGTYRSDDLYATTSSCSHQLQNLGKLFSGKLDFAVIDGNHEGPYLAREIQELHQLLKPGGLLFLDDVCTTWFELERIYQHLDPKCFQQLGTDGRVGVAIKT